MALAAGTVQPSGLAVAAISAVFIVGSVARMLGEDEDWLQELSISMEPEDGRLHVYGVGEDGVTAFTRFGIEYLQEIRERQEFRVRTGMMGEKEIPDVPTQGTAYP